MFLNFLLSNFNILKNITPVKISGTYNTNTTSSILGASAVLIILFAILVPLFILIYTLVKLHQISKNTKNTYKEIVKLNYNLHNVLVKNNKNDNNSNHNID